MEHQQFISWFNTYKQPLHDYLYYLTGDHSTASDLTQELFIKVWLKRERIASVENVSQDFRSMAHNAAMNWFQKVALNARLAKEVALRMQISNNEVYEQADYRDARIILQEAVDTLSPQRRRVFEMSRQEGLRLQEIADRMGLSIDTVKHHLTAALTQVRTYYLEHAQRNSLAILIVAIHQL